MWELAIQFEPADLNLALTDSRLPSRAHENSIHRTFHSANVQESTTPYAVGYAQSTAFQGSRPGFTPLADTVSVPTVLAGTQTGSRAHRGILALLAVSASPSGRAVQVSFTRGGWLCVCRSDSTVFKVLSTIRYTSTEYAELPVRDRPKRAPRKGVLGALGS